MSKPTDDDLESVIVDVDADDADGMFRAITDLESKLEACRSEANVLQDGNTSADLEKQQQLIRVYELQLGKLKEALAKRKHREEEKVHQAGALEKALAEKRAKRAAASGGDVPK